MTGIALALDHVGLCTADPAPLWSAWERLGFALSPVAQQSGRRTPDSDVEPFGTVNRCAFLRHGYVELLGIADPNLFANGVDRFVARYTGAHIVALAMDDAEGNLARLRAGGLAIPGIAWLQRPVEPGGPTARFARLPFPDAPEGRVQLVQHLTPELVWDARWMGHRNGAEALESVIVASAEPAETMARLARLAGVPAEPDPLAGFRLRLPGAPRAAGPDSPAMETRIRVLPPEALDRALPGVTAPALPFMAGFIIRTNDRAASARALLADLPLRDAPEGVMVPPEHAGGAAVIFA
ncbi:VOC family protein [Falsiroseomonas bella]|uniref:VOC family protein n=1 Tax=Falsiroseomonas bella TaxID=2184016 RepID=A0A317FKZ1_9PROT|nr:VOC family protein [Falsiroseomonas bella]PWS38777.1 VOC family protein [Falsiroseomonas bella]